MSIRPSLLWKSMTPDQRLTAADAFWHEDQNDIEVQQAEAVMVLARRMNFRPKSMHALPIERRAKLLAQLPEVSDAIATRALISYHFTAKRELMAAFLDAVGIQHENGLIQEETVTPPTAEKLAAAIADVRAKFPAADVELYLRTLSTLDGDTWTGVDAALAATPVAS